LQCHFLVNKKLNQINELRQGMPMQAAIYSAQASCLRAVETLPLVWQAFSFKMSLKTAQIKAFSWRA
jgi:hypothetical protein